MRSRLQVGLAVGCAGVMAGCGGDDDFDPWSKLGEAELGVTVCADGPTIEGIDVAAYQPDTDWKKVADSGRRFAVIKATEGTGYVNSYFAQDWAGTKANGMVRGAYHYFRPDTDGVAQANHFLATVGALDGDELLMLDLETTDGQSGATVGKRAKDWMETVEAATGKKPIMYTGPNFWDAVIGAPAGFAEYPLWIAHYGVDCPLVPGDWGKWKFHQYTSTGQVPGINNPNCDRDVFNGTFEDLKAFAGGKPSSMTQVAGNDAVTLVTSPGEKKTWLFARTAGGELAVMSSAHGEKKWSEPALLGSGVACGLSAAFSEKPAPRGELVAAGEDGEALQAAWGADGWSEPVGFEGDGLAHPTTLSWPDGRIEAFAIDEAGQLQHRTSDAGTDVWSAWKALGDVKLATGVSVILRGDGRAQMFGTDGDGVGWHALSAETAGEWEEWKALDGEIASRPVPVRWPDGHLELFARDVDGELAHALFDAGWKPFEKLGAGTEIEGEPSAIMNPGAFGTAGPEVVARDADGNVLHLWWLGAAYGDWSPHFEQRSASDPFLWVRGDGHAELLVVDDEGQLVRSYHAADGWTPWEVVASAGFDPCAPDGSGSGSSGDSSGSGSSGGDGDGNGISAEVSASAEGGCAVVAGSPGGGAWSALALIAGALVRRRRGVRRHASAVKVR